MTGYTLVMLGDKMLINMLRILLHNVKQLFLAGSFIIGAGGLHHMTRAIKLVTFEQVLPTLFPVLYREVCIKIAVLVLCGGDFVNQFIYGSRKLFIGIECERICRRFYPFCRIAVLKHHTVKAVTDIFPVKRLCGILKVLHNVALFRVGCFIA